MTVTLRPAPLRPVVQDRRGVASASTIRQRGHREQAAKKESRRRHHWRPLCPMLVKVESRNRAQSLNRNGSNANCPGGTFDNSLLIHGWDPRPKTPASSVRDDRTFFKVAAASNGSNQLDRISLDCDRVGDFLVESLS